MTLLAICLMAVVVFALRLGGFLLAGARIPPALERPLRFTPVAALAAVTATLVANTRPIDLTGVAALTTGAIVAWRTRQLWACIVAGVAMAVALRHLSG